MAGRKQSPGLLFYRMDSGHIVNDKIRLLMNEFDSDGYYIWKALLDYGYSKYGYYFDTNDNDRLELFASDYCRKKITLVKEVIAGCLRRGLFDKTVYEMFGVLTCDMMQEVFLYGSFERRKKGSEFIMRKEWLLINPEDYNTNNILILTGEELKSYRGRMQQTETKTETKTEKNTVAAEEPPLPQKVVSKKISSKKKKEEPPEPFWSALVAAWFDFNTQKYLEKHPGANPKEGQPSFHGQDPKIFKRIIGLLKKRASAQGVPWDEISSVVRINGFLTRAWENKWLRENFLLSNLEKQFDTIVLLKKSENEIHRKSNETCNRITGSGKSAGAEQLLGNLQAEIAAYNYPGRENAAAKV